MVKNPPAGAGDLGLIPDAKIPHAAEQLSWYARSCGALGARAREPQSLRLAATAEAQAPAPTARGADVRNPRGPALGC